MKLRQRRIVLVAQEVDLQPHGRATRAVQLEPRVVHRVLVEIREDLRRVQRTRRREQHLIEVSRQAHAGRVAHRVLRTAQAIRVRLHAAQEKQRRGRRTAGAKSGRANRSRLADVDLLDVRVHGLSCVGSVEEFLGEAVDGARACEALVQKHGAIGNSFVELGKRRVTMLGPLVRMPTPHRRDPLPFGHVFTPRRERFLHAANRGRVLEDRVITGPVSEAHAMDMRLDQAGHHRTAAEVDDSTTR